MQEPGTGTVQSLGRAVGLLRFVAGAGEDGTRLSDAAAALGLHKASAARLLASLVALDVLDRGTDRRFRVAAGFREAMGQPVSVARLREAARPALSRLAGGLGDAAFLSVRGGFDAVCVDRQVGAHPIQALSLDVGARRPLGVGAGSLALLAFLPEAEFEEALAAQEGRLERYPLFSLARLRQLAAEARGAGFTDLPNFVIPNMTGMGVPLRDGAGLVVGALSVAAVGDRLTGARRDLAIKLLRQGRDETEARLAGRAREGGSTPAKPALSRTNRSDKTTNGRKTA